RRIVQMLATWFTLGTKRRLPVFKMPCAGAARARTGNRMVQSYFGASSFADSAPAFLRLSQLYLRWNFSTRPVVSMYFILPVKKGWQAEQISTAMCFLVLRVLNLLPQPQVTVASSYLG